MTKAERVRMAKRGAAEDPRAADRPSIRVRGARVHNLRDIDVDLPHGGLVVLTGVSGSGKSSLAFDTLHAEGRRRYVESLSTYARQLLDPTERPDVDLIDGLPPTVAIDQQGGAASPRSTVGTVTEIQDYLRLLFARTGVVHCSVCGGAVGRQTPEQIVATVLAMTEGQKLWILAPLVRGRKGLHFDAFQAIRRAGLLRARVDGEVVEIKDAPPKLAKTKAHDIEAVVDRIVVRAGIRPRLAESIDLALKLGNGSVLLATPAAGGSGWDDRRLSVNFSCPACGTSFAEPEPRTFSFNSPYGACPRCDGLGTVAAFDPELVVPDRGLSLEAGAIAPWRAQSSKARAARLDDPALRAFLKRHRISATRALKSWPSKALSLLFQGEDDFPGILARLEAEYASTKSERRRAALDAYRVQTVCPECGGSRLRPEARSVTIEGRGPHEVAALPISQARPFFESLRFAPPLDQIGRPLVREIAGRLAFLERIGLGYLSLDRGTDTLSGGELQRVRLATQLGSGLAGVCYILDEPTSGLHPRDTGRLLGTLTALRDAGNSVLIVEHDEAVIRAADWLVDLGPGAGPDGGRVVAWGPPEDLAGPPGESLTAGYLARGPDTAMVADPGRLARSPGRLRVVGASARNLRSLTVEIPLGTLTSVTGVSGSGKSTLVHDVLAGALRRHWGLGGPPPGEFERIEGMDGLARLVAIDQAPIGRGPRSTPSTYTGVFDEIRKVYARTREAKVRGFGASRFSFNVKGGRCEVCAGQGWRRIPMNFLPDLNVRCTACRGKRFNRSTLAVLFKGKSIGDVLEMRVDEARELFEAQPGVRPGLDALHEAGLGYITLGQSSTTLSGGEAQRVKLAAALGGRASAASGRTLYILDEPTTGLHFADVERLLRVLNQLIDQGNTVVAIEHNLDVIRASDWIIDLGPEGGPEGGQLVAIGPPEAVAQVEESRTGAALRGTSLS
jgi:excinuclease ABC subunit A